MAHTYPRGHLYPSKNNTRGVFYTGGVIMPGTPSRYARNANRRRKLRARLKAQGGPCAICGQPIDYDLPAGDPLSFEVDEIIPFSLGGDELDFDNLQPVHRICNERKGNKIGFTLESPFGKAQANSTQARRNSTQSQLNLNEQNSTQTQAQAGILSTSKDW